MTEPEAGSAVSAEAWLAAFAAEIGQPAPAIGARRIGTSRPYLAQNARASGVIRVSVYSLTQFSQNQFASRPFTVSSVGVDMTGISCVVKHTAPRLGKRGRGIVQAGPSDFSRINSTARRNSVHDCFFSFNAARPALVMW